MADLIFYDGVCGLCDRLNQFILKRDSADRFRFTSLQGSLAHDLLHRYGRDADDLNTVYVIVDHGARTERLLSKGRAVIHVLKSLGGAWKLARVFDLLPLAVVDALYAFVARHRYRWFGHYDACAVPTAHHRAKFLDEGTDRPPTT